MNTSSADSCVIFDPKFMRYITIHLVDRNDHKNIRDLINYYIMHRSLQLLPEIWEWLYNNAPNWCTLLCMQSKFDDYDEVEWSYGVAIKFEKLEQVLAFDLTWQQV